MKLYVHIDRLVLDGAPGQPMDRDHLVEVIRSELSSHITANGLPEQLRSSSMRPYASERSSPPDGKGTGMGAALYGSLNQ